MKGRKPQKNAIRRGRTPSDVLELAATPVGRLQKPDEVLANPDLDVLWDQVVGDGVGYQPQDVPVLTQLVYWMDVAQTCRQAMTAPDGRRLVTVIATGKPGPDGTYRDGKANPYFAQMERATNMILRLSDQLGCTPLARARIGIAETATQSMQVDIAAKIRALMDEREGRA